jgi:hypothetical protein
MMAHKNVYIALSAAQAEMGPVVKGAVNPHFRSKYADLSDVMQVALPALNKHGIAAWHSTVIADGTTIMRTTLSHGESDTHINCDVPLIVAKNDMQGMKSATTYAKRIGIESLTGIAPEDDDGNAAAKAPPKQEQRQQKPQETNAEAIERAKEYLAEANSLDDLKERWGRIPKPVATSADVISAKDAAKERLSKPANDDLNGDQIPY